MNSKFGRDCVVAALMAAVALAGCSQGPRRIDCERQLVPINAPASKVTSEKLEAERKEGGQ